MSGPYPVYMLILSCRPDPASVGSREIGLGVVKLGVLEEVGGAALGSIYITNS